MFVNKSVALSSIRFFDYFGSFPIIFQYFRVVSSSFEYFRVFSGIFGNFDYFRSLSIISDYFRLFAIVFFCFRLLLIIFACFLFIFDHFDYSKLLNDFTLRNNRTRYFSLLLIRLFCYLETQCSTRISKVGMCVQPYNLWTPSIYFF